MRKMNFRLLTYIPISCRLPCFLVLFGLILMVTGNLIAGVEETRNAPYSTSTAESTGTVFSDVPNSTAYGIGTDWRVIIEYHQNRIAGFLKNVKGVGKVSVLVYCDSSSVIELVENSVLDSQYIDEKDSSGGSRLTETEKRESNYLTVKDAAGNERVVAISESIPAITSICVVCSGGGQSAVQERVITALSALYDLPAYKIVVLAGE